MKTAEEKLAGRKAYYARNRDKILAHKHEKYLSQKEIKKEYNKQYRLKNWHKGMREKQREYRQSNHQKLLDRNKKYYHKNKAKVRSWCEKWNAKNKEKVLECGRRYDKNHPEKRIAKCALRRAKQMAATIGDPKEIEKFIGRLKRDVNLKCYYCDTKIRKPHMHIDHIDPISRGGAHAIENMCAACPRCNMSKSDKTFEEWFHWLHEKGVLK